MTGHAFSALPIFVIFLAIGWVASVPLQARVSSMQQGEYGVPSYLARYMADRGALLQNLDAADGSLSRQARALRSKPQSNTVTDNKPASSTQAQVYDFDGIDRGAMGGLDNDQPLRRRYARALYGRKRNIDEIDSSSFDSFFKRNLDEIDRVGWNSFVKRVEELTDRMDQY